MRWHYQTFNYSGAQPGSKTFLTGIRGVHHSNQVYISGVYILPNSTLPSGLIYKGGLCSRRSRAVAPEGTWHVLNYPSALGRTVTGTSLYGPNNGTTRNTIQAVGNYTTQETGQIPLGCLYQGPLDGSGTWITLIPSSSEPVINTIVHSTMGNLAVGNYDTMLITGKAFIYDIDTQEFSDLTYEDAVSMTVYGIWHNSGRSYTICGGYTSLSDRRTYGYVADWNRKTKTLTNFKTYAYDNEPERIRFTHFDGITGACSGYHLTGDQGNVADSGAFFTVVKKNDGQAKWKSLAYPGAQTTSGNSVYKNIVIGIYTDESGNVNGYLAQLR